jgi:hypothetical protein
MRLRELAASRIRFGYRPLTVLLRREGWQGECQTDLSAVDGRRADGVDPTPHEGRGPSLCAATRGDRPEPAVEYGLHERARSGWPLVSDSDHRGPVHAGMLVFGG